MIFVKALYAQYIFVLQYIVYLPVDKHYILCYSVFVIELCAPFPNKETVYLTAAKILRCTRY